MDLRIERTYASLTQAFTELLEQYPYEQITIAQLCEKAPIRRTTFYKHFADKDEFFAFFVVHMRDEFQERCAGTARTTIQPENLPDMLEQTVGFLLEHKSIVDHVIGSPSAVLLLDALKDVLAQDITQAMKQCLTPAESSRGTYANKAAFLSGGIIQMIRNWWDAGQDQSEIENMARLFASSFENLACESQ